MQLTDDSRSKAAGYFGVAALEATLIISGVLFYLELRLKVEMLITLCTLMFWKITVCQAPKRNILFENDWY